jgi:cob(I)alamin adenosyltransferase
VLVFTGKGKGKTTAALGTILRAWGRGMSVAVVQFLKSETVETGEVRAAERLGIEWISTGDGFSWRSLNPDATAARAVAGWELAKAKIAGAHCDMLLLDEFTYPLLYGWLDTEEVIAWLREHRPPAMHLIITGRHAPAALLGYADLVTEMQCVKHPLAQQGIHAQPGIEF